ncbi:MAG: SDR family oxidoreductase [Paracoccaceae bacterium]
MGKGGAKGLGAEFARALAAEGARVAIADIADGTDHAAALGGLYVETDVTDPKAARRAVAAASEAFGPVDILVNNAALYAPLACRLTRSTPISGTG